MIRDVGTLDNQDTWVTNYANGLVANVIWNDAGPNDHPWASFVYLNDALGRPLTETSNFDDLTHLIAAHDPASSQPYSLMTTYYGANWLPTTQTGTWDTGDIWSSVFTNGVLSSTYIADTGVNDHDWIDTSQTRDALGRVVSEQFNNDNLTHSIITFDPVGTQPYSTMSTVYGSNWLPLWQVGTYDSGNSWSYTYTNGVLSEFTLTDTININPWASYHYAYNTAGQVIAETAFNDDHTITAISRDPGNIASYSLMTTYYGVNGLPTWQTGTYHSGDTWTAVFTNGVQTSITLTDTANIHGWSTYNIYSNAQGQTTAEVSNNDNDTQQVTLYDRLNVEAYSVLSHFYGANGALMYDAATLDNGDTVTTLFNNGAKSSQTIVDAGLNDHLWLNHTLAFDLAGHTLTDTYLNDDGTRAVIVSDATGLAEWTTVRAVADIVGNTISTHVDFRDGAYADTIVHNDGSRTDLFTFQGGLAVRVETSATLAQAVFVGDNPVLIAELHSPHDGPELLQVLDVDVGADALLLYKLGHMTVQGFLMLMAVLNAPTSPMGSPPAPPGVPPGSRFIFSDGDSSYWQTDMGQIYVRGPTGTHLTVQLPTDNNTTIGIDKAGTCAWTWVNRGGDANVAWKLYSEQITGVTAGLECRAYDYNRITGQSTYVDFDGFNYKTGVYLEAKGGGYAWGYNTDGSPKLEADGQTPIFNGHNDWVKQLLAQSAMATAQGRNVVWNVAEEGFRIAVQKVINDRSITNISVVRVAPK